MKSNWTILEKETHVVSVMIWRMETDAIRDKKDNRPLLHHKRRHRLMERYPQKSSGRRGEKVLREQEARFLCRYLLRCKCTSPSCNHWHPPLCLTQDAHMAKSADSDALRLMGSPAKSQRKVVQRISCDIEQVFSIWLCVSRFSSEKIYSTERRKIGIKSHRQIVQGHVAPHKNSGKKGFIARRQSKV